MFNPCLRYCAAAVSRCKVSRICVLFAKRLYCGAGSRVSCSVPVVASCGCDAKLDPDVNAAAQSERSTFCGFDVWLCCAFCRHVRFVVT